MGVSSRQRVITGSGCDAVAPSIDRQMESEIVVRDTSPGVFDLRRRPKRVISRGMSLDQQRMAEDGV